MLLLTTYHDEAVQRSRRAPVGARALDPQQLLDHRVEQVGAVTCVGGDEVMDVSEEAGDIGVALLETCTAAAVVVLSI